MYSTRLALFIHGITSAKRTCELRPVVFVGESSARLLMYSLDIQASDTLRTSSLRKAPLRP